MSFDKHMSVGLYSKISTRFYIFSFLIFFLFIRHVFFFTLKSMHFMQLYLSMIRKNLTKVQSKVVVYFKEQQCLVCSNSGSNWV